MPEITDPEEASVAHHEPTMDERRQGSGRRDDDQGSRPHQPQQTVNVNNPPQPPQPSPPALGLSAKLAPWGNVSALVLIAASFLWSQSDGRERDRLNSQRLDSWLTKSEDREIRAWESRSRDRETAMKHGDEAVRKIETAMTQQTIETGRQTKAVETALSKMEAALEKIEKKGKEP